MLFDNYWGRYSLLGYLLRCILPPSAKYKKPSMSIFLSQLKPQDRTINPTQ